MHLRLDSTESSAYELRCFYRKIHTKFAYSRWTHHTEWTEIPQSHQWIYKSKKFVTPSEIIWTKTIFFNLLRYLPCTVEVLGNLAKEISNYDCLCLLSTYDCPEISDDLKNCAKYDAAFEKEISCLWSKSLNVRIIYSPLGKLSDHDDVRKYAQAAGKAIARAKKAGSDRPVIALPRNSQFQHAQLITLLGALEELYLVSFEINRRVE